jgi:hypothetical protein
MGPTPPAQKKKPGRPRKHPLPAPGDGANEARSRNLANDSFFQYLESRANKENADCTIYRTLPVVDNGLVGLEKSIDLCPAGEFSLEWIKGRYGFGKYEVYFNDGSDRSAYAKGVLNLSDMSLYRGLYEDMMDPAKCKIDLRTVLDVTPNRGYIAAWTARGMWPPNKSTKEEEMENGIATKALADIATATLNQRQQPNANTAQPSADSIVLPILLKLIDNLGSKPAQESPISRAEIQAQVEAAASKARLEAEVEALKRENENLRTNPGAGGINHMFGPSEKLMARMLNKKFARLLGDDEEPEDATAGLVEKYGVPLLRRLLTGIAAPEAMPPQPAQAHNPAQAPPNNEAREQAEDLAILQAVLRMFVQGKPASVGAAVFLMHNREDLYDELQRTPVDQIVQVATTLPVPEAQQVAARRDEFRAWVTEAIEEYAADDEPAAAPAAPQEAAA